MLVLAAMAVSQAALEGMVTELGVVVAAVVARQCVVPADRVSLVSKSGNRALMRWLSTTYAAVRAGRVQTRSAGRADARWGRE